MSSQLVDLVVELNREYSTQPISNRLTFAVVGATFFYDIHVDGEKRFEGLSFEEARGVLRGALGSLRKFKA